jgi:hypothetical protein
MQNNNRKSSSLRHVFVLPWTMMMDTQIGSDTVCMAVLPVDADVHKTANSTAREALTPYAATHHGEPPGQTSRGHCGLETVTEALKSMQPRRQTGQHVQHKKQQC